MEIIKNVLNQVNYLLLFLIFTLPIKAQTVYHEYRDLAVKNPEQVIELWKKDYNAQKDAVSKIYILMAVSHVYMEQGKYDQMIMFLNQAIEEAKYITDEKLNIDLLKFQAYGYYLVDMHTVAEELTIEHIRSANNINDVVVKNLTLTDAYSQLGSINKQQLEYGNALNYFKKKSVYIK